MAQKKQLQVSPRATVLSTIHIRHKRACMILLRLAMNTKDLRSCVMVFVITFINQTRCNQAQIGSVSEILEFLIVAWSLCFLRHSHNFQKQLPADLMTDLVYRDHKIRQQIDFDNSRSRIRHLRHSAPIVLISELFMTPCHCRATARLTQLLSQSRNSREQCEYVKALTHCTIRRLVSQVTL